MEDRLKQLINNLPQFREIKTEVFNNYGTHAYMFVSNDKKVLESFSIRFANILLCGEKNKPCGECVACKKIDLLAHPDLVILPKDNKYSVKTIEWFINDSALIPLENDKKVYIFNDFENASNDVQNKLLKTLEMPPKSTTIILNVAYDAAMLPTISSRCKKLRINHLKENVVFDYISETCKNHADAKTIACLSEGNLTRALNFADNDAFVLNYNIVLETLENLKNSATMLQASSKLVERRSFIEELLEIFESICRDLLMLRLKKAELVSNKSISKRLEALSEQFSADALDLIIKKIYLIKKQLAANCNASICIDSLLIYILEVKATCK